MYDLGFCSLPLSVLTGFLAIRDSALAGTCQRGLWTLYDVVTQDDHEDLVVTMQYYLVHGSGIFEDALSWTTQFFRRERRPLEGDRIEARRERLPFSGDVVDGPPLAWVIYWKGRYSNRYGDAVQDSLQHWGYVFWDRKRLIESKGIGEILREREVFQQW